MKNFSHSEILQVIDAVSHEKSIAKRDMFVIIEDALRAAAKRQYGFDPSLRVRIDRDSGEVKLFREMVVVDNDHNFESNADEHKDLESVVEMDDGGQHLSGLVSAPTPIKLDDARRITDSPVVGDILREDLPPLDANRFAAKIAKNVMSLRIKSIERKKQYEEFKNKVGEIVQGVVDKMEFGNVIVKIGDAEGILKRPDLLRSDKYHRGDRVKACLVAMNHKQNEPQLVLSRTANEFLIKLFEHEVPEIYDNIVEIVAVVRDPGSRAKVAVHTTDPGIDPVGACVGIKGSRVQAIINELHGEKIDIIQWTQDRAKLVLNAMSPLDVLKLVIDEKNNRVEVVVEDGQESAAIGRRGQNVRLIAGLLGMNVVIMTKDSEAVRRKKETEVIAKVFMEKLDLEEMLAQLLIAEGYTTINELASATVESLLKIPGLDTAIAQELISRALDAQKSIRDWFVQKLDITEDLAQFLVDKGFDTIEKLCYAQTTDLVDEGSGVDSDTASELINRAREYRRYAAAKKNSKHDDVESCENMQAESAADVVKADDQGDCRSVVELSALFPAITQMLDEAGIRTVQKIADLDNIELKELLEERGYSCDINAVNGVIMAARAMLLS